MECPICLEPYTGSRGPHLPKVFSCGHSICELCLKEFSGAQLECALCRATVDAANISTNYALCSLLDAEIARAPSSTARTRSTTARSSSPSPKARSDVPQNNNVFTVWTRLDMFFGLFNSPLWTSDVEQFFLDVFMAQFEIKRHPTLWDVFLLNHNFVHGCKEMAAPKM